MEEEDGKGKRGVQKINLSEAGKVRENAAKERNLGLSLKYYEDDIHAILYLFVLYERRGGINL